MNDNGRPTKLTPATRKAIVRALATGNSRTTSSELAGIDFSQFKRWMNRGRSRKKDDAIYRAFRAEVVVAEAKAMSKAIRTIRAAGRKNWQALAWWASRKDPDNWSDEKKLVQELRKHVEEQGKMLNELLARLAPVVEKKGEAAPTTAGGKPKRKS